MKPYNHALQTLKFDIAFFSEEQSIDLHKRVSRLSAGQMYSIINKVCDEVLPEKSVFVQINKLEIDLGSIPYSEIEALLPNRLYDLFRQTLKHQLSLSDKFYNGQQPMVDQTPESRHNEELLFIFLQQGTLPWWALDGAGQQLEPIFLKLLKNDPQQTVARIYEGNNFSSVIQRIVYQFSDTLLSALVEILCPAHAQVLIQYATILGGSQALSLPGTHDDKKSQWKMLFAFLNPHISRNSYDGKSIVEFIINRLAAENDLTTATLLDGVRRNFSNKPGEYTFQGIIEELALKEAVTPSSGNTVLPDNLKEKEAHRPKYNKEPIENKGQNSLKIMQDLRPFISELQRLQQYDGQLFGNIVDFTLKYNEKWKTNNDFNAYAFDFFNYMLTTPLPERQLFDFLENTFRKFGFNPDKRIDKQRLYADTGTQDKTETYYIENAGLVLLNPFLLTFYEMLGLMNKNEFTSKHAADKAIHLLQFLVDGEESHDEHLLLLNKILCGRDIHEPIEKEIRMSESEKKTSISLLNAAIDNWPRLKNSSIATLRTEFLLRNGKLKFHNGEWVLRIAHNGRSDYLLTTLPWSFNMIKNSWMPEILTVEWT